MERSRSRRPVKPEPGSNRWIAPRIPADLWLAGPRLRCDVRNLGALDLAVERDPLECLRLGSYFGTCLGLGGVRSETAVLATLEINKRIVYARNTAGAVVARQLLALSEDDRLVCFRIYPHNVRPDVRAAFRDYDRAFAAQLGLPVHDRTQDNAAPYEIAPILSDNFWDDGAWNFHTPL